LRPWLPAHPRHAPAPNHKRTASLRLCDFHLLSTGRDSCADPSFILRQNDAAIDYVTGLTGLSIMRSLRWVVPLQACSSGRLQPLPRPFRAANPSGHIHECLLCCPAGTPGHSPSLAPRGPRLRNADDSRRKLTRIQTNVHRQNVDQWQIVLKHLWVRNL